MSSRAQSQWRTTANDEAVTPGAGTTSTTQPTAGARFTRENLESHSMAARREEGRRRGQSTPSPPPDLREHDTLTSGSARQVVKISPSEWEAIRARAPEKERAMRAWLLANESGEWGLQQDTTARASDRASEISQASSWQKNAPGNIYQEYVETERHIRPVTTSAREPPASTTDQPRRMTANKKFRDAAIQALPSHLQKGHAARDLNEVSAIVANAGSILSLGGRPCNDLNYTIIAVPEGQEALLLARHQPGQEDSAKRTAYHDDDFSDAPLEEFNGVEQRPRR